MNNDLKILSDVNDSFEKLYISVRTKEGFVYSDEEIYQLPNLPKAHPQYEHWKIRRVNSKRFEKYIQSNYFERILEIGCGNGWFTNRIASVSKSNVVGIDVNLVELRQAHKNFSKSNLTFAYGDILEVKFPHKFDLIVFNASIHYFKDLKKLLDQIHTMLDDYGEIHILDSKFYSSKEEIVEAQKRTKHYYSNLGIPEMADFYFHNLLSDLSNFEILEHSKKYLFFKRNSPFKWYRYRR